MATQATARLVARETKLKQQAARVLQELYDVALDETVPIHSRLHAMKLFLNKTMPDLKAIEYKADIHEEQVIVPAFLCPVFVEIAGTVG